MYGDPRLVESTPLAMKGAQAAGVNVALGADCLHGRFWFEAEVAMENGATAHQALMGMTSRAAIACGVEDEVGSPAAGRRADVVVVDGNPFDDIKRLSELRLVMKDGAVVRSEEQPARV